MREYRERSRDRDYHHRRDHSRERERRRRNDSTDSRKSGRRRDSRERAQGRSATDRNEVRDLGVLQHKKLRIQQTAKNSSAVTDEEKKKAERLAKLEAWKQKQQKVAAEKQQKELQSAANTRTLLDEIDKKAAASPANVASPESPATPAEPASPVPYAGKFDPKAIAKKAATNPAAATSKLGTDVMLPEQILKASASSTSVANGLKANKTAALGTSLSGIAYQTFLSMNFADKDVSPAPSVPLKARGNLSGFGLAGKAVQEPEKSAAKKGLDFGEEEGSRMKLEKLPIPSLEDGSTNEDAALTNGTQEDEANDDDDEDVDMEGGTEEEAAAAARAAAEKREERLQAQNLAYQAGEAGDDTTQQEPETNGDVHMEDVPAQPTDTTMVVEEEDVDPLDAFMTDLTDNTRRRPTYIPKKKPAQEPQALFGDDIEPNMTAVDQDADDFLAIANKRKKKDIPKVNHAKVAYEPFQKSFYVEPSDLAELTEEEVTELRLELEGIKVTGKDVPKPAMKWSQCGLSNMIQNVIDDLQFEKPSAIQAQAIPSIMSGRDVIGVAKTGSGKTMAFLLPLFRHIAQQRPLANLDGPIGLIMTPTRELATQIHRDCKPFLKALSLRAVCAYGGAPIKDQIAQLKTGAHIIVCTPGRMIDLLAANSGRVTNLRRITYVVLDEADRMFDMGFEPQVMKITGNIRPDRQTVLFSATFPRQMEALASKACSNPVKIIVGGRSVVAPEITQIVEIRPEESKFLRLLELLGKQYEEEENQDDRTLIFVDRHESADGLMKDLMRKGYSCLSLHGGQDQTDRNSTIEDFKAGNISILIATSVAARGLDVKQLKLVVNFDAPNHLEDYVHRAGRTGRAGNTGTAVTFLTPEQDRYSVDIAKALKQSGQSVPDSVQELANSFLEKVKAGKEKASASGFGGKGLERLDQERDATRNRERKAYKTGDEPEEEEKEDNKASEDLIKKAASSVQSASAPAPQPSGVPNGIDLEGKIVVHKSETPKPSTGTSKNPLDKVSAAVAAINAKLGSSSIIRPGVPIDNKGPDAGAYHATLEINDFSQAARWRVTNRSNVAKILESTGTSITTKGSFYAAGKEPGPGEQPKLYILVEGDTEVVVTNAMRELMRLLKEGMAATAESESRAPASGRYSVV